MTTSRQVLLVVNLVLTLLSYRPDIFRSCFVSKLYQISAAFGKRILFTGVEIIIELFELLVRDHKGITSCVIL